MNTVHLILTGKGGVGKSFVSTLLAQYLSKDSTEITCADTDPSNPTFSTYAAFRAHYIKLMNDGMNIDKSGFDDLIELLLESDRDCVVDNGSSSFIPLTSYILENDVIPFLLREGKNVVIHAVLIGGLGLDETQRGVESLLTAQAAPLVIWENELYGPVEKNGITFANSKIYHANKDRILSVVNLKQRSEDTFGKDMKTMTTNRLTFDEAMDSALFRTMSRQRLLTVQREIYAQLDQVCRQGHSDDQRSPKQEPRGSKVTP